MPVSKKRTRLPPEDRRAQLIRCAIKVAAAKGLGRTVHADVARRAQVAVPTAFLYFPNREALLTAVVQEVDRFYMAMAREHHSGNVDPLQALRDHFQNFGDSVDSAPDYAKIWLEWSTLVRNDMGLWDAFLDFQERVIRLCARSIRQGQKDGMVSAGISVPDSARLLVASSYTLAQLKFMQRSHRLIQRYIDQALLLIFHPQR